MKKPILIYLLTIISQFIFAQHQEWQIFKSPGLLNKQNPQISNLLISLNGFSNQENDFSKSRIVKNRYDWFDHHQQPAECIPDNFVVCIAQDSTNNIWIGTFAGGVAKYDGKTWTVYNTYNSGLPSNTVYSLLIDEKNNLWIATTSGLAFFDGKNWEVYKLSNSKIPSDINYSLACDKSGNKWIGTGAGLAKFDGKRWTTYNLLNSRLPDDNVTAISIDNKGNKWIGTFEGLVRIEGANWKIYNTTNSAIPFDDVYSITPNNDGEIIVSTWGGGLAILKRDKWKVIKSSKSGMPDNFISSILIDDKEKMLIGTLGGLAEYDGKTWKVFNSSNSLLPDNNVYSLLKDRSGNLWIGTKNGLAVYKEDGIISPISSFDSFIGKVNNRVVNLYWGSKSVSNISSFEIEKRTKNSNWEKIGTVRLDLFSNPAERFSFVDNYPAAGENYYRIKEIDYQSNYNYSNTPIAKIELPATHFLEVHSLMDDNATIKLKYGIPETTNTKLSVFDEYEREVAILVNEVKQPGIFNCQFSFSKTGLPEGIYFIRLQTENIIKTKKVQFIDNDGLY